MRELTSHKVNGLNECIVVDALDEPGPGNANHLYRIHGIQGPLDHHPIPTIDIRFRNAHVSETAIDDAQVDGTIDNGGTLHELHARVRQIVR